MSTIRIKDYIKSLLEKWDNGPSTFRELGERIRRDVPDQPWDTDMIYRWLQGGHLPGLPLMNGDIKDLLGSAERWAPRIPPGPEVGLGIRFARQVAYIIRTESYPLRQVKGLSPHTGLFQDDWSNAVQLHLIADDDNHLSIDMNLPLSVQANEVTLFMPRKGETWRSSVADMRHSSPAYWHHVADLLKVGAEMFRLYAEGEVGGVYFYGSASIEDWAKIEQVLANG